MKLLHRIYTKLYRLISGDTRRVLLPRKLWGNLQNPTTKKVFILTYCKNEAQLYGTTLIFHSIRVGFPTAFVVVIDNASTPTARHAIKKMAAETGCYYFQLESEIPHAEYLEDLVMNQPLEGTVVNLDPDVVLWENCESWRFGALLAGSLMPSYIGELSQCITKPRIHTSFYWIQDIKKLRKRIAALKETYFEFDPFRPWMFPLGNAWHRFDTGGTLYAAIRKYCHHFTTKEHNAFDHLYGGTHLNLFVKNMQNKHVKKQLLGSHAFAQTDHTKLRGIWKKQLVYLRRPK